MIEVVHEDGCLEERIDPSLKLLEEVALDGEQLLVALELIVLVYWDDNSHEELNGLLHEITVKHLGLLLLAGVELGLFLLLEHLHVVEDGADEVRGDEQLGEVLLLAKLLG